MPEFVPQIFWRDAWFTMEATGTAELPPFVGSTIRGALGHLLRTALCETSNCGHDCQKPESCRYFALFERSQSASGQNIPKPFVLLAPPNPGLEEIALGGPVNLPYRTRAPHLGEEIAELRADSNSHVQERERLRFGVRLLGVASTALPAIVEAVAVHGLSLAGTQFRLCSVHDAAGQLVFDWRIPSIPVQVPSLVRLEFEVEAACRIRIAFLSPTLLKLEQKPTFDPIEFAARFFEHSMVRAVQVHQAFSGSNVRIPWQEPPRVRVQLTGHRLYHYLLPRHSYRQEKWLDFDGVVGFMDLSGELTSGMPWARAAEALNFGQKAAFGLGRVRVFVLE